MYACVHVDVHAHVGVPPALEAESHPCIFREGSPPPATIGDVSPGEEERILRDAILAGDERAWGVLFDRHFPSFYSFVDRRAGGRAQLAEDIVQESFLVAIRRLREFDPGRASFGGWLRGIALNLLRNQGRSAARRGDRGAPEELDSLPSPERHAAPGGDLELAEEIALAMAGLPDRYRAVLRARYEEGLAVGDIALRLGETAKAVESLLSRAREAFRAAHRRISGER